MRSSSFTPRGKFACIFQFRYAMSVKLEQVEKSYHSDQNIIYSCQYHVIFCPKYRGCILAHVVADRLKALLLEKRAE